MKKIALFANNLNAGGIQKSLYNIVRNMNYQKYAIDVYLMSKENFFQEKFPKEVKIHYLKKHSKLLKLIPFNLLKIFIPYEGLNKEYDVAIDFDSYQQITALNAIKCKAKKKVYWIHNNMVEKAKEEKKFKISHFFSKSKLKYFDEFVGVSKGVIEPFKTYNKLPNIKYRIIPNLIDTKEIFNKINEDCSLKVNDNIYNICTMGTINRQKGFDILLKYIKELLSYRQDFHLYLIGDGPLKNEIDSLSKTLELDDYVTFLGYQKNPYQLMNLMDAFILTSRYEGQGMVLWEAKALGLELFMTKNLEQYNEGLKGCDDIVTSLRNAKKKKKKYDDLKEYNKNIIKSLEDLFDN